MNIEQDKNYISFKKGNYTNNLNYFFHDFPHTIAGNNDQIQSFLIKKDMEIQEYGNVEVKKESWVLYNSVQYEENKKDIKTNIETKKYIAFKSRAIDKLIENLLNSYNYTPEHMLVLDNPYQLAPLTALILFYTKEECRIKVTVKGLNGGDDISGVTVKEKFHRIPVFGLYPEKENQICLEFLDEQGEYGNKKIIQFSYQGCMLPKELKNTILIDTKKESSSLGLIFVYGAQTKYPYAFDHQGDVRYYLCKSPNNYGIYFLSEGKFLLAEKYILSPSFSNPHSCEVLELDLTGRVYHMYHINNGIHHDACETYPNGNIITAGNSLEQANEDTIIEIDRKTGEIIKEIKLKHIFNKKYQNSVDWIHINTVSYDQKTKTVIVCLRNLHSVIKIDWVTGELKWILCHPEFWKSTEMEHFVLNPLPTKEEIDDDGWFYQPHAAYFLSENLDGNKDTKHLIIYDNHQIKKRPVSYFDGKNFSYVRIYEINEKNHTVALYKSFPTQQSIIRSNALYLHEEQRLFAMSGFLQGNYEKCGMVEEFDVNSKEVVNRYFINTSFYRAYRLFFNYRLSEKCLTDSYRKGNLCEPYQTKKIGVKRAITIPEMKKEYNPFEIFMLLKKSPQQAKKMINTGQDMAYMKTRICEDVLYIHIIDHTIKKVYFIGKKYFYIRNYEDTIQNEYNSFGRIPYAVAISIKNLEKDYYRLYILAEDGNIYNTGKYIKL